MIDFDTFLATYGLTKEQYEQVLRDVHYKVLEDGDIDWQRIVDKNGLTINKETLRKSCSAAPFGAVWVDEFRRQQRYDLSDTTAQNCEDTEFEQKKHGTTTEINKDGSFTSSKLIQITEDDLKNPAALLKAHGFDHKEWELVNARNSIWNSFSRKDGTRELYSSKITVKPKFSDVTLEDIECWFNRLDRKYEPINLPFKTCGGKKDKLLLIDIADLHMNLQASMFVTGNEYNCDIAQEVFLHVIEDIIGRIYLDSFEKIIFCIGGDMLNSDNISGTTTKGTIQNNDKHLFDAYEQICALTIKTIDKLREIAPVHVVYVPGNHDMTVGFKLAMMIHAWFRNDLDVTVDYSPLPRKYIVFGTTLLVFAHDGDVKRLPKLIADEAREYWSSIDTTEVFLQHLHGEAVLMEEYNMRIQRLPTISAKSEWTVSKGYNSKRQHKSFIFDKEDGLKTVLYTPIKTK